MNCRKTAEKIGNFFHFYQEEEEKECFMMKSFTGWFGVLKVMNLGEVICNSLLQISLFH